MPKKRFWMGTSYIYPEGPSASVQWKGDLAGDISGTYYYSLDIVESSAPAILKLEFIISRNGGSTVVAAHDIYVDTIPSGYYRPYSAYVSDKDLETRDGDILTFRVTHIEGEQSVVIGLDGVEEYCDSYVKVFYKGPVACFSVSPKEGDLTTEYSFDAACSWDSLYQGSELEVRWDFDGDGTYDTAFSGNTSATYRFSSPGVKNVKLQVRNPDGALRTRTERVVIDMVVLSSFSLPGPAPAGLAWDGEHLWVSDVGDKLIHKVGTSGEVIMSFSSPCGDPMDLTWDGEHLWVIDAWGADDKGNVLYKVDSSGKVERSFPVPRDFSTGLTWDGHFLWAADGTNGRIAKIDPSSGEVVASFSSPGPDPRGLAWDGQNLWVADFNAGEISKIDVNGNLLSTYPSPGTGPMGLAWDGHDLWCADLDSYKLYRITDGIPTVITCGLSRPEIILGEPLTITGRISPAPGEAGIGISVELTPPDGETIFRSALADIKGEYRYQLECNDIIQSGKWSVSTSWSGRGPFLGADSDPLELDVEPATVRISVNSTSQAIKYGEEVDISGKLTPQPHCGRDLSGIPLEVHLIGPDGETVVESTATSDPYGHYVLKGAAGMDMLGHWQVEVRFPGNGGFEASSSGSIPVHVVETAGYAILVQGKISTEEGLESHKKTLDFVYSQLKARGLLDEDIKYFGYDASSQGHDAVPSKSGIQAAVTQWAVDRMNATPGNLYIVMVDHGFDEVFYINPETIGAAELGQWLDELQAGLTGQTADQEILVMLGFCRSGSFIKRLSGPNRLIIASADASESSYKGPLDADGIRDGEYFVSEFFKQVAFGKSVKACFEEAARLTERFTATGGSSFNAPFYDDSRQHPLLDDNNDGKGSNVLKDPLGDGLLSRNLFIGVSALTGNDPGNVAVVDATPTLFLTTGEDTADLWARVDNISRLNTIWVEVKPPGYAPVDPGGSGQVIMDLERSAWERLSKERDRYEWPSTKGFKDPGLYQVFYFAKDLNTDHVSPLVETTIYKAREENRPPEPFSLLSPGDGEETMTTVVLDWEDTMDPDGDPLTYTVLLSKGDPYFNEPVRLEGLRYSACLAGPAQGIEDISEYYWKVLAVDSFGTVRESDVWSFKTNNANPVVAWISGHVYSTATGRPIFDAVVKAGNLSFPSGLGGYYLGQVPPGTHAFTAQARGYGVRTYEGVWIGDGELVRKDFALETEHGFKISDAILILKMISGIALPDAPGFVEDMDQDGKPGIAEALYILQTIAGIR